MKAMWALALGALVAVGTVAACTSGDDSSGNGPAADGDDASAGADVSSSDGASSADAGPTSDANTSDADAASIDAGDWAKAGKCNTVVSTAPFVETILVGEEQPSFDGGIIEPGTYVVTRVRDFTGAGGDDGGTGQFVSETWVLTDNGDGTFTRERGIATETDAGITRARTSDAMTPNGVDRVAITHTCNGPMVVLSREYGTNGTGTGATFEYVAEHVYTLTKQ